MALPFFNKKSTSTPATLPEQLPTHVAFIMDGNGRWATRRGLPRKMDEIGRAHV